MELTPERKRQIEDEERQRVAEEQYRAQVRAEMRSAVAPPAPCARRDDGGKGGGMSHVGLLLLGILGALVLFAVYRNNANGNDLGKNANRAAYASSASPSIRYVPATTNIASGQVTIPAGGYVQYRFQITPEMRNASVNGHFNASGGRGNDVAAVIATESEYTNWINGHPARAFYGTNGKETTDSFDVHLAPGVYYFAISNRFSTFSSKYVFLQVDLNYSRLETY